MGAETLYSAIRFSQLNSNYTEIALKLKGQGQMSPESNHRLHTPPGKSWIFL